MGRISPISRFVVERIAPLCIAPAHVSKGLTFQPGFEAALAGVTGEVVLNSNPPLKAINRVRLRPHPRKSIRRPSLARVEHAWVRP